MDMHTIPGTARLARVVLLLGAGMLVACGGGNGTGGGNDGEAAADSALFPQEPERADCSEGIGPAARVLNNGFAVDAANTGNASSAIDSDNVDQLRPAFADVAPDVTERRGAPAVTEQAIFAAAGRDVLAIDRRSGCRYWSYRIPQQRPLGGGNAVRSSAIYYLPGEAEAPPLVLAGDAFGYFYAVDARDGSVVWSRFLGTEPRHHWITGAPQLAGDRLLVPVASKEVLSSAAELLRLCCSSHGLLRALDPRSGELHWSYHTTDEASYHAESGQLAPSGATIWSAPAVDEARSQVYIGTGQNLSRPVTDTSDAIIALDLETGERKWAFQSTPDDAWNANCLIAQRLNPECPDPVGYDHDFGAPPILARRANGSDLVVAGAKNGVVYALDPDSGAVQWQQRIGIGSTLGGIHWGMATDGERVYAAVSDASVGKVNGISLGNLQLGAPAGIQPVASARPGVYALDLDSGAVVWERRPQHEHEGVRYDSVFSAALRVTNDVVFAGSLDGTLHALRSSDGETLWRFDTAVPVDGPEGRSGNGGDIDGAGPVIAGDSLMVNSGYDTFGRPNAYQAGPGNALFVFRLGAD